MDSQLAAFCLRNLRPLDVENLQCGRITRQALEEAIRRTCHAYNCRLEQAMRGYSFNTADEINEMLQAAQQKEVDDDQKADDHVMQ